MRDGAAVLKQLLRQLLGEYQYWKVFRIKLPQPAVPLPPGITVRPLDSMDLQSSSDVELRSRTEFGGEGAQGYALYVGTELAAMQWFWWGARYDNERQGRSWRLPSKAAKSVGLFTVPRFRGKGYAAILKMQTAHLMSEKGFDSLYSRIWHSHYESIRVSEKAGWQRVGAYIEVCPFGRRFEFRMHRWPTPR
jgi:hypothetical protein